MKLLIVTTASVRRHRELKRLQEDLRNNLGDISQLKTEWMVAVNDKDLCDPGEWAQILCDVEGIRLLGERKSLEKRPSIDEIIEMAVEMVFDKALIVNSDIEVGQGFADEFLSACLDTGYTYAWHRKDIQDGVDIGYYMHGVDMILVERNELLRVYPLGEFFRFGKVGWDYAFMARTEGLCKFKSSTYVGHKVHPTAHTDMEWSASIYEVARLVLSRQRLPVMVLDCSWKIFKAVKQSYLWAKVVLVAVVAKNLANKGWDFRKEPYRQKFW